MNAGNCYHSCGAGAVPVMLFEEKSHLYSTCINKFLKNYTHSVVHRCYTCLTNSSPAFCDLF